MVRIVTGRGPFQGLAFELDLRSKDGLPRIGLVDDSITDFLEDSRLRMPNARMDVALPGLQVEKVAWRHVLRRPCFVVPEMDPDMGLVRTFVRREPNVPVNPRDGSTERARVSDDVRTDLLQAVPGVAVVTHGRFEHDRLKLSLVRIKPFFAVVLRQTSEESEELRREIFSTFPHATLLLNALPILDHGSAVEHWREGTGVEDDPDRPDLVSSDAVPFADERR